MLYRCVQEHLETWLAHGRDGHDDEWSVPEYVEREFRRYLDRGILAHGFARARCGQCGHEFLIAFSCQGRGVCPSCNARRMVATAAHLADHVLPPLPVRQWVLAVPKRLRYFLQRDADLQGGALRLFLRAVESCLRAHSPGSGPAARRCGTCPRPGRATATPTPSRHPSTRSINASPGNLDRRPAATCGAGLARACGRHAQPARTAAGARLPRTAEKHPHNGAQPSHLPARSPASTRDSLIR